MELVNKEYEGDTLESSVKESLLSIFNSCLNVLKKDSFIMISHHMNTFELNHGINYAFWENVLTDFRKWANEAQIGREVFFDGFEPQWWMFIQKT